MPRQLSTNVDASILAHPGMGLRRCSRQLQRRPDSLKYVTLSNSAGIAFVNGGSQRHQFPLVALFLAF